MTDNPIIFWALSGFFALGVILVTGLALICLSYWCRFSDEQDARRGAFHNRERWGC